MTPYEAPLLNRVRELSSEPELDYVRLQRVLDDADDFDAAQVRSLFKADASKPYGRQVLFETDTLEAMLATWTPGVHCAPHDHGGSVGAVRVVQGASHHKMWAIKEGQLELIGEEIVPAGSVIACDREIIHSMGCAGAGEPLVTLHLYTGPVPWMVVYDTDENVTHVVDGGCGAWVPHDQPELIVKTLPGLVSPGELEASG